MMERGGVGFAEAAAAREAQRGASRMQQLGQAFGDASPVPTKPIVQHVLERLVGVHEEARALRLRALEVGNRALGAEPLPPNANDHLQHAVPADAASSLDMMIVMIQAELSDLRRELSRLERFV